MNSTVWTEQICEGLKSLIQSIITFPKNNKEVPIPVHVKKPDEDFKIESYPMAYIYNFSISKRDPERYYPFKVLRNANTETFKGVLERSAVPHSLFFQIDFYTTLQSDMDKIMQKWLFEAGKDFNLPVTDSGGTERTAFALNTGNVIQKQDNLSGSNRVFCSSFTYRIWAEIDEENVNNLEPCDLVSSTEVNCLPTI